MHVSPVLIIVVVLIFAGFFGFVVERAVAIHRKRATTGTEEMAGAMVVTRTPLTPEGQVIFKGERWEAISESGNLEAGQTVVISKVEGLILHVKQPERKQEVTKS